MKQSVTTKEQFEALRQTQLAYRDALNAVSRYAFSQGKISTVTRLHEGMYAELRARYHLPSQLACSMERQVSAIRHRTLDQAQEERQRLRARLPKGAASANRVYSQWSFAELQSLISYKATLAIKVDADYTSKACPMCGHIADENRPRKGLLFVCQNPSRGDATPIRRPN